MDHKRLGASSHWRYSAHESTLECIECRKELNLVQGMCFADMLEWVLEHECK